VRLFRLATPAGPRWAREESAELRLLEGDPWQGLRETSARVRLEEARLLAPVVPSKVVGIGVNYRDHAAERGKPVPQEPLLFLKPPTTVIGPGEPIRRPDWVGRVDHEAELGLVIGRTAREVASPEAGAGHILGVVCVNDVTARELQSRDVQFTRAKGFDSFCPVGPCLVTGLDLADLRIQARVNGQLRQSGSTRDMVFSPGHLVWYVSRVMSLLPGDMITTGTPAGIGPLQPGDVVEVEIEGIGVLSNPVQ